MKKFKDVKSVATPWLLPNIDTDVITPMYRLLNNLDEMGWYSFAPYRFVDGTGDNGELNPDFPLNQKQYLGSKIMLVGENFGCGSSRESAVMAIAEIGFQCLIGPSFGGIFFKNCFQQGILPIILPMQTIQHLADLQGELEIDLENCQIICPDGVKVDFEVAPLRQRMLLNGLDDVKLTLEKEECTLAFIKKDSIIRPWVYKI
jgi:3-isopropylmalate/(R)-2-methylmalate dehydratase small subunit